MDGCYINSVITRIANINFAQQNGGIKTFQPYLSDLPKR